MFELFFKYPFEAFAKGQVVLLGRWPVWLFMVSCWREPQLSPGRPSAPASRPRFDCSPFDVYGCLQTATLAMLLLMLWQPALSVATLRPQQNIVAVVADDSRSMASDWRTEFPGGSNDKKH